MRKKVYGENTKTGEIVLLFVYRGSEKSALQVAERENESHGNLYKNIYVVEHERNINHG